jgi:hypothetical protein
MAKASKASAQRPETDRDGNLKGGRKAPVRMSTLSDAELADTAMNKLLGLVRPLSTRPRFRAVRSGLFAAINELGSIAGETDEASGRGGQTDRTAPKFTGPNLA